ncbi:MAG: hypothetical protein ACE5KT_00560 [Methanosarcinales archaeon]
MTIIMTIILAVGLIAAKFWILPFVINESTLLLGDLKPDVWKGFRGNATFDSTGLSKQDISGGYPLVKIKVTWTEDGRVIEKILLETEIVALSQSAFIWESGKFLEKDNMQSIWLKLDFLLE